LSHQLTVWRKSISIDSFRSLANCNDDAIAPNHCVGVQLRFNLYEFACAAHVTEELSSSAIKKDNFSSVVIMDFLPVTQKPVKDGSGYASLLQTSIGVVC
jgi:hypothetical protein